MKASRRMARVHPSLMLRVVRSREKVDLVAALESVIEHIKVTFTGAPAVSLHHYPSTTIKSVQLRGTSNILSMGSRQGTYYFVTLLAQAGHACIVPAIAARTMYLTSWAGIWLHQQLAQLRSP